MPGSRRGWGEDDQEKCYWNLAEKQSRGKTGLGFSSSSSSSSSSSKDSLSSMFVKSVQKVFVS
ncbi:hypothetical protein, conserved, partial [Eimeria tenella]